MENEQILTLENKKDKLIKILDDMVYGSIRTKNENGGQFIYVRRLKNGEQKFELVGEFSRELYDMILLNCKKAKIIRNKIREINRKIKELKNL